MDALLGNLFALGGASLWSISSLLFARSRSAPLAVNLAKNLVAALALTLTLAVVATQAGRAFLSADTHALGLLAVSSLVGLVLGDTFHFRALRAVGARKALVLETLAPVFAALLAWVLAGETLGLRELAGMALTLLGVVMVVGERRIDERVLERGTVLAGALYGTLAALGQAVGATLSKSAIAHLSSLPGSSASPALEAAMLRLWVALALGLGVLALSRARRREARHAFEPAELKLLAPAGLLATYGGMWMSLLAFQHTSVAVASTLLALSPVLILPLAHFVQREHVSRQAVAGALVSVGGVALLFLD